MSYGPALAELLEEAQPYQENGMLNERHERLIEREDLLIEVHCLLIEGHEMLSQREGVPIDAVGVEEEDGLANG